MSTEKAITVRAPIEIATFEELSAQTQKLNEFYKGLMQEGTDFGIIPGTPRPTLLKPGAELLRLWAGLAPEFKVIPTGTDFEHGLFNYEVICRLSRDGVFVGEGVGSCNSLESKYRYRWVWPKDLPTGFDKEKATTKKVRTKNGWVTQYRIENDNPQDLANTILKMAKKRAFVDAILTVTGASRIFTQDIEDMTESAKAEQKVDEEPIDAEFEPLPPEDETSKRGQADQRQRIRLQMKHLGFDAQQAIKFLQQVAKVDKVAEISESELGKVEAELVKLANPQQGDLLEL